MGKTSRKAKIPPSEFKITTPKNLLINPPSEFKITTPKNLLINDQAVTSMMNLTIALAYPNIPTYN